jgi:multidrug efflux pump subunit AcrB
MLRLDQCHLTAALGVGLARRSRAIAGQTQTSITDIGLLTVPSASGEAVAVRDVATISRGPAETQSRVSRTTRNAEGQWFTTPAVTLAVAKREGANAVVVATVGVVSQVQVLLTLLRFSTTKISVSR